MKVEKVTPLFEKSKPKKTELSIEATGCGWIIIVALIIFIVAYFTS